VFRPWPGWASSREEHWFAVARECLDSTAGPLTAHDWPPTVVADVGELERVRKALQLFDLRRAKDGVPEPVFYQGQVVGETRRFSDTLAMFILKSKRRDVWGEKQQLDVSANIMMLFPRGAVQKALQLFDLMEKFVERARQPPMSDQPLVYDPGGDLPLLVVPNQKSGFGRD
jgi:hypothetical protein